MSKVAGTLVPEWLGLGSGTKVPATLLALLIGLLQAHAQQPDRKSFAIAGMNVVPHTQSPNLRWRKPPDPELGARVELFLKNTSDAKVGINSSFKCLFDDKTAGQLLESDDWAWHDTPSARKESQYELPPQALTVWSFNSRKANWGVGTSHTLSLGPSETRHDLQINSPKAWISSVTFISEGDRLNPDQVVVHLANQTDKPLRIDRCRLWLPSSGDTFLVLKAGSWLNSLKTFPSDRSIPAGEKGGFTARTPALPLTYAALEVECALADDTIQTLWAHVRIKREVFDTSGGWVASDINGRNSLTLEPYLKTLKRMHINTGQIEEVGGYTDNEFLYKRFPIKRFNRMADTKRYGTDEMLPQIHAVEFLGEPQYGGGRPVPPQEVWEAFEPYQKSKLHTSVTHSEERIWRYYAGLSDYPHYDAYRVTAPAADSWRRYDRWNGQTISWGAPLETITDLTRSLRDLNRPRPIAYWSQGAHAGWRSRSRERASPTPDELRAQAYHALAHRITSIYWFNLSLKSLLKFPDLIAPITDVNRIALTLEPLILSGDAFEYRRVTNDDKPDWDLSSITGPDGGLFFANDIAYVADAESKTFTFSPREATLQFKLPHYLSKPTEVFRIDSKGVHDVDHEIADSDLHVRDRVQVAGIYVAAGEPGLRQQLAESFAALVNKEKSYGFDPASSKDDFNTLKELVEPATEANSGRD